MMTACRSVLLTLLLALLLGGCGAFTHNPYPPFRYRMTVEVETPEGLRTGSAVREVSFYPPLLRAQSAVGTSYRGEAVAVDLPGGRVLYALLSSSSGQPDYAGQIPFDVLLPVPQGASVSPHGREGSFAPRNREFETLYATMIASREVRQVPRERARRWSVGPSEGWPLLVTFRDAADPASVVRVDADNPAATLGEGVRIRRIALVITDDPVTVGIDKRLGWSRDYQRKWLNGESTVSQDMQNPSLTAQLSAGSFSTELAR